MTIYERPTKSLLAEWAVENLKPGQTFAKDDAARWFATCYPKIKGATVNQHVEIMSINNRLRKHYPNIRPGSGHDLFYKLGPDQFRLWKPETDPAPRYIQDFDAQPSDEVENGAEESEDEETVEKVKTGKHIPKDVLSEQQRQSLGQFGIRQIGLKIRDFARHFSPTKAGNEVDLANSIILVSCVKSKLPYPAPARSLYTSAWFRKTRDIVEASGAKWFVLSSLYGLVAPDAEIAPYDYTLNTLGVAERRAWAKKVMDKLLPEVVGAKRVVMFAGHRYREFLIEPLEQRGAKVEVPMAHLARGEQLAWLSEH
jgi:hypothetical protein